MSIIATLKGVFTEHDTIKHEVSVVVGLGVVGRLVLLGAVVDGDVPCRYCHSISIAFTVPSSFLCILLPDLARSCPSLQSPEHPNVAKLYLFEHQNRLLVRPFMRLASSLEGCFGTRSIQVGSRLRVSEMAKKYRAKHTIWA
jgi:hypothetical protein